MTCFPTHPDSDAAMIFILLGTFCSGSVESLASRVGASLSHSKSAERATFCVALTVKKKEGTFMNQYKNTCASCIAIKHLAILITTRRQ